MSTQLANADGNGKAELLQAQAAGCDSGGSACRTFRSDRVCDVMMWALSLHHLLLSCEAGLCTLASRPAADQTGAVCCVHP